MTYRTASTFRQEERALQLMRDYLDFAESIGCVVFQDEIHCNAGQAVQLMQWWREKTMKDWPSA